MEQFWERIKQFFFEKQEQIILFVAVLVLGYLFVKILSLILSRILKKSKLKGAAADFLTSLIRVILVAVYLIALLALLGVPTTSLVALLSAFALAVSLALQGTFSNVASGIVIVVTKPFIEGDYVEFDGVEGTVETITVFNTKLTTADNKVIVVPNGTITAANLINYTAKKLRRLDVPFSVCYGSSIDQVRKTICEAMANREEVLKDPAPKTLLKTMGDSSLNFVARVWVKQEDYWPMTFALNDEIYNTLNEAGIRIPFPQLDVHLTSQENK